jgi:DnaJ-domain-containing protein 1
MSQIEQLLGPDAEPDPAFFIDSWTVGAAAASENYLRRRHQQKNRERQPAAWSALSAFVPFLIADSPVPAVPALPQQSAFFRPTLSEPRPAAPAQFYGSDADDESATVTRPCTLEAACRLLGVTPVSTREQIKLAYRKMASRYHPDRAECTSLREQERATERMASINEAYRLLCESQHAPSA